MHINASYYTACGRRDKNEDCLALVEGAYGLLAIVSDGLGGYAAGEVASRLTIDILREKLKDHPVSRAALAQAIQLANHTIAARQSPALPMRSAVAVLWMDQTHAIAANVGDCRIYQLRKGQIIYQSTDHSIAQMTLLSGENVPHTLRTSPDRNKLVRALGDSGELCIDFAALTVMPGDRFLICSDGFWEPVTELEMLRTSIFTANAMQWLSEMNRTATAWAMDNQSAIAIVIPE